MIRKVKGGYRVVAKSGRNMGTYKTEEEAKKRLRQIELFKHQKPQAQLCYNCPMKNVVIFYGYSETPQSFWYPYVKKTLENKGYKVVIPKLPNTNDPKLDEQLEFSL